MAEDQNGGSVSKLEARWVAFLTAIALMFGGWWLQNQYETVLRVQQQLTDFQRHVDDGYVRKEYLLTIADRVRRLEEKLDKIEDQQRDELRHSGQQ
jgi:cell division protein FtsB